MTNEKAIEVLKQYLDMDSEVKSEYLEAQRMAIKALEQQPSEDCISREAVKKLKKYRFNYDTNTTIPKTDIFIKIADIEELPSVTSKASWIPVGERLPKDHENVLIYLSSNKITIGLYNSHKLPFRDKPMGWGVDAQISVFNFYSNDVIAWMPLPEPYKEDDNANDK